MEETKETPVEVTTEAAPTTEVEAGAEAAVEAPAEPAAPAIELVKVNASKSLSNLQALAAQAIEVAAASPSIKEQKKNAAIKRKAERDTVVQAETEEERKKRVERIERFGTEEEKAKLKRMGRFGVTEESLQPKKVRKTAAGQTAGKKEAAAAAAAPVLSAEVW